MKAIILERRGEYAAVLCEDGTFEKRQISGEVGETVDLSGEIVAFPAKKNRWAKNAVAAALALVVTGSTLGYMGGTAGAYVSLDVGDSAIELTVNHFGRVIAVNAVSGDAKELAENLSAEVRHQTAEAALSHTMDWLREGGYVTGESASVVAGIATDNSRRSEELSRTVADAVDGQLLVVTESSRAERERAKERGISVGRFGMERDRAERNGAHTDTEAEEPAAKPAVPASEQAVIEQPERGVQQGEPVLNNATQGDTAQENRWQESSEKPSQDTAYRERQKSQAARKEEEQWQERTTDERSEQPRQDEMPGNTSASMQNGGKPESHQEQRPQGQPGQQDVRPQESERQGQQESRPPESELQEQQESRPPESERPGQQDARPPESAQPGQQDARPPESEQPGQQDARPQETNQSGSQEAPPQEPTLSGQQEPHPQETERPGERQSESMQAQRPSDTAAPENPAHDSITQSEQRNTEKREAERGEGPQVSGASGRGGTGDQAGHGGHGPM